MKYSSRAARNSPAGRGLKTLALDHGCARVSHCVTARWRNFSHYCRPLRHYDVWFTCSDNREALQTRRQQTVYTNKRLEFATEQVGRLRNVTAVDGGLKRFPSVTWFAHQCSRSYWKSFLARNYVFCRLHNLSIQWVTVLFVQYILLWIKYVFSFENYVRCERYVNN